MTDESTTPQVPVEQSGGLLAGFSEVAWAIVGTGFLLGILIGAIFVVGQSEKSNETPLISVHSTTPASSTLQSTTTHASMTATDLVTERDRLARTLEAEKLRLEVEALRQELAGLQSSTVSLESDPSGLRPASESSRPTETKSVSPGEATLTYWNQLNAIILQEAALRSAPTGGVTASNAGGFLDARIQAAKFAANSMRELETDGVDSRVVTLGEKLAAWYEQGSVVAEMGQQLLAGASAEARQGTPGQQYQAAEKSHSKSVNAINTEGGQVRRAMSRKYRLDFPPLN